MEKNMKTKSKSYYTLNQRITAFVMATFMLLQICLPAVAAAGVMIDDAQLVTHIGSPVFTVSSDNSYAYQSALMLNKDASSDYSIATFYSDYNAATGASLAAPQKIIGDSFVQNRLIRAQVRTLLGRFLIDKNVSPLSLNTAEKKQYEDLFKAGITFAKNKGKTPGARLTGGDVDGFGQNFIWPEVRVVNGSQLVTPIIYLTQSTADTRDFSGHLIEFNGNVLLGSIVIDGVTISAGRGALIESLTNIVNNNGVITGSGDLTLKAGSTLSNLSGNISAAENLAIFAGQVNNKTLVFPFKDKNGVGTHLGTVSKINAGGNLEITADNDITYTGATSTSGGILTLTSHGDITLEPVETQTQSQTQEGHWRVNQSTLDLLQSKLTAEDTISLLADGKISIKASELLTSGGIKLLAGLGIYVEDDQGNFQSTRTDKIGKTRGTGSDFESFAVRSVLSAGKGVLLSTTSGDVVLKGAKINSGEGTKIEAKNGKVRLLITKENSQHYLDTVRKGMWTIKTVHEEYLQETGIPNAIIGGLAVEALTGVDIEYAGREGATLAEQIAEYKKMSDTAWMADVYEGKIKFKDANGNDVPIDISKVDLAYKHIREHNTSLSPAAMAIIAIAMAVAMGPAGAGLIGGSSGSIGGFLFIPQAAMQAGALTLATAAAQNLAAGKDLDETFKTITSDQGLKNLAISMATAGALNGLDTANLELFTDTSTSPALNLVNQAYQAVATSVVNTGVSIAINGGNSKDYWNALRQSLAAGAVNVIGQSLYGKIGGSNLDGATRYIANAAMGCLTEGLSSKLSDEDFKDACSSGAGGAVISQAATDLLQTYTVSFAKEMTNNPDSIRADTVGAKLDYLRRNQVDISKLIAGLIAFSSGGDVNSSASAAEMTARSNAQNSAGWLEIFLDLTGDRDYGDGVGFAQKRESLHEFASRQKLKNSGWSNTEIDAFIAKEKAAGIFSGAAMLDDEYWASGKNINVLLEHKNSSDSEFEFNSDGNIQDVLVMGDKTRTFAQKVALFSGQTERFRMSLSEREREGLSLTAQVVMGGPVKALINKGIEAGVNLFMPQSAAELAEKVDQAYNKYVGGAGIAWLLDENYGEIVDSYENKTDAEVADDINGLVWITQNITGLRVKKNSNSSSMKGVTDKDSRISAESKARDALATSRIFRNADGLSEVKAGAYSKEAFERLNKEDAAVKKPKPAEAIMAAQLESELGEMKRYEIRPGDKNNPDFEIVSGPHAGKTVDAMYTTENFSPREIENLNKFYEKNMTIPESADKLPKGQKVILEHLEKADFVPIDFRILNSANQMIFINYIKTLTPEQQAKFIIVR